MHIHPHPPPQRGLCHWGAPDVLMAAINDSKAGNISSYPSVPVSDVFRGSWWMRALLICWESSAADGAAWPSHLCCWRGGRGGLAAFSALRHRLPAAVTRDDRPEWDFPAVGVMPQPPLRLLVRANREPERRLGQRRLQQRRKTEKAPKPTATAGLRADGR